MSDREAALAKGRSLLQKKLSQKRDDESQSSTKKKTLKTVAKAAPKDNDAAIANENVKENVKENENENEKEKEKASVVYDEQTLISEASLEEPKSADEMTMQIPSMKSVDDETSHPLKTDNFPVPLPSGASLLESGFPAKQTMSDFSIVSEETKSSAPNVSFSNTPLSSMKDKEEPLKLLIEEKEAEMKRTYEMMAELQEKNTSSQKQVEILTLQNQSLSKERDLLAKNLKVAKEEVEKMRSESIRLHDINLLYETRANEKTSELKALAGLHAELEETFTLTVSKCKTLEADLALAKANSQALSNLQTDYDRTKASLQAAQETHSALQKQYHTLDLTRKSLETTVDELKGKLESQERRLIDRNAYAERMEKDLLVKQSQVADLQAQNDELMERLRMPSENESMYQQQLKDLEEKYGQLQMQYEKAASQTLAADEFLEREKLNIKQIEAARDAALVKGDKLQASLESTNQQLEHLQQEYNTLQIEKQSVESQFAALQGEYKRLEAQDSSESTIEMIVSPAAVSQIKTLEDKLRDVTHEKDAMETQISSLLVRIESLTASCKIMEHDLDETRNKLDESKTAESLLEAKYAELERTDLDKEKIVLELRNEIDHLKRTMDEKILECNQNGASSNQELQRIHQKQVEEITNILQTAEHDRDLAQEKLLEMTMNLRVEKEKLTVLEQELNRIKTETIELRQTISDQNMKLSRQTAEMEKQTRLIAQVTQAAEQIKTQCQNLEAENIAAHEHQRMYEIAQQDIKSLTTKLRELEAEKITTASERDAIADQVCQLQTRMAEKESVVIQSSSLLTELQNEKSRLQEELNKRAFAYDELRRDFSSNITVLEEYKAIMNEQQSSIQQLDQTLGAVQIDKEASEKRCAELQDRCDNLERELDKVRKEFELSSLSNKQKSSLDASLLTELQVESEKVQSQIDGLVQSKALIEKENMSLLSKVSLLERELTLANEEKFKTVQSLQTLQEEKDNINLQVSTLVEGSRRMEMECNTLRAELDRKSQELSQTFSNLQLRETELKTISNLAETRVTESQDKELTLKRQLEVLEQSYQSLSTRYDQLKGTVHEVWSDLSRSLPTASLATPTKQDDDLVEFLSNIPQLLEKEKAALNQQVCKEDASSKDQSRKDKPPATGRKFMMPTEEKKKFIEENMTLLKQVDELSDEIRQIEPKLQINSRHRSLKEVYGDDSGQASDDFSYPLDSVAIQMLKRLAHHLGLVGYLDGEMDDTKAERLTMEIISIIASLQQIKNLFPAKEREIQDLKKAFMLINKQFDEMKERCIQLEMNKVQMGELSKLSLKQQETIHGLNLQLSQHERDFAVEEATKQRFLLTSTFFCCIKSVRFFWSFSFWLEVTRDDLERLCSRRGRSFWILCILWVVPNHGMRLIGDFDFV
eukprot:TRINITY_DN2374_c0_g1_i3.p1 TRINITY_DN2374_c0_g1~~TRINITY_DN2374_c0_g1_i3.p1  ORF type:complete len:1397 (-),score=373.70 TRINITY_DN2374_c0_g1_i3:1371-5561(-)